MGYGAQSINLLAVLVGFAGGSVSAALLQEAMRWWRSPIIRADLVDKKGCYVDAVLKPGEKQKYLRLKISNAGRSTLVGCTVYATKIAKTTQGKATTVDEEVLEFGWSHRPVKSRDIPPGAFFYVDIAALRLMKEINVLAPIIDPWPGTLKDWFKDAATYKFDILVVADNSRPFPRQVEFMFDPTKSDLIFSYD